jgi:hypothetical protein
MINAETTAYSMDASIRFTLPDRRSNPSRPGLDWLLPTKPPGIPLVGGAG